MRSHNFPEPQPSARLSQGPTRRARESHNLMSRTGRVTLPRVRPGAPTTQRCPHSRRAINYANNTEWTDIGWRRLHHSTCPDMSTDSCSMATVVRSGHRWPEQHGMSDTGTPDYTRGFVRTSLKQKRTSWHRINQGAMSYSQTGGISTQKNYQLTSINKHEAFANNHRGKSVIKNIESQSW